jgi:hypothetical protein
MSEEKGKRLGDLFSLDGHTRLAQSEEEYRRLLELQGIGRGIINALLNTPDAGAWLLEPMPMLPEQQQ